MTSGGIEGEGPGCSRATPSSQGDPRGGGMVGEREPPARPPKINLTKSYLFAANAIFARAGPSGAVSLLEKS